MLADDGITDLRCATRTAGERRWDITAGFFRMRRGMQKPNRPINGMEDASAGFSQGLFT